MGVCALGPAPRAVSSAAAAAAGFGAEAEAERISDAIQLIHIYIQSLVVGALDPLELLDTDKAIIALHSHGVDQLIWTIHLSH